MRKFIVAKLFRTKYDKHDQQGKAAAFNERSPTRSSNKSQWQGAQEDPIQKQDRTQGRTLAYVNT
jgi:hypothetical protein